MLMSLPEFTTAVQALLASKEQALSKSAVAAGEHLCFIGSGREEEDQYVHMVVAHFLQRHLAFVSVVAGGYAGLFRLTVAAFVKTVLLVKLPILFSIFTCRCFSLVVPQSAEGHILECRGISYQFPENSSLINFLMEFICMYCDVYSKVGTFAAIRTATVFQ